jgi:hypothetical protein
LKKIAIFVEGMTEQALVVWLVESIAGAAGLQVVLGKQFFGKVNITAVATDPNVAFYVLVVDCCNDDQVKTQIRDQYPTLIAGGYTEIIGLRDVYPSAAADVPHIAAHLLTGLPTTPITPKIHLALMEVEAWFIGEITHFPRLSPALSLAAIEAAGFPLSTKNAETWENPATTLHSIYKLQKFAYKKTKKQVQRTVASLSFHELSGHVRKQLPALSGFLNDIEQALA